MILTSLSGHGHAHLHGRQRRAVCEEGHGHFVSDRRPARERLTEVAPENGMLLMLCDQCANERGLAECDGRGYRPVGTVPGVQVGCLAHLYKALAGKPPDQVMTL